MYAQEERQKEKKGRAVANSVAQKKSNAQRSFGFVNNRHEAVSQRRLQKLASSSPGTKQPSVIQNSDYDRDRETSDVTQFVLVAQLATRLSSAVQFQGSADALRNLIYRWNYFPGGMQVQVQQTDLWGVLLELDLREIMVQLA
ncbi:MAG: hypothetical protein AAF149_13060 [Bacteroidota bacterium]